MATIQAVLARRTVVNDCWLYTGSPNAGGYGQCQIDGQFWYVHRLSWTFYRGAIPSGLQIDHLCRVKLCFNPDHLEPVTGRVNVERALPYMRETKRQQAIAQTHCHKGHAFAGNNLMIRQLGNGRTARRCRTCLNEGKRRRRQLVASD